MLTHFYRVPQLVRYFFPGLTWRVPHSQEIFITFDDGPIPNLTPWVLDTLARYNARATFFCVGDNLRKNTDIARNALAAGHRLGNHTYNHVNAWHVSQKYFLENVEKCDRQLQDLGVFNAPFRPPYGRITRALIRQMEGRRIIMWDLLSGDYRRGDIGSTICDQLARKTVGGSVIVFHDNAKAEGNLRVALPRYLQIMSDQGYKFLTL